MRVLFITCLSIFLSGCASTMDSSTVLLLSNRIEQLENKQEVEIKPVVEEKQAIDPLDGVNRKLDDIHKILSNNGISIANKFVDLDKKLDNIRPINTREITTIITAAPPVAVSAPVMEMKIKRDPNSITPTEFVRMIKFLNLDKMDDESVGEFVKKLMDRVEDE